MITKRVEEFKDGTWGDVRSASGLATYTADQYKGLIGDEQPKDVVNYLISVGISSDNLRVVEDSR